MGNINASSAPPSPPTMAPPPMPPLKPILPPNEIPTEKLEELNKNPGSLMELHKSFKELLPNTFEGAKFLVNKPLSSYFSISHQMVMNKADSGYTFGTTYVEVEPNAKEPQYVLSAEMDPNFNVTGNVYYSVAERIKAKSQVHTKNGVIGVNELSLDYRGETFTANAIMVQPELLNLNGLVLGQIFQQITPSLAIGAEVIFQKIRHQESMSALALATKYLISPQSTICFKAGNKGASASYHTKRSENFQIGVEVETDTFGKESAATLAYQLDIPQSGVVFRGMANSSFMVGATLEKKLNPMPFSLTISALMDHKMNNFQVGVGFNIGGP